jgi:hypothetical protein
MQLNQVKLGPHEIFPNFVFRNLICVSIGIPYELKVHDGHFPTQTLDFSGPFSKFTPVLQTKQEIYYVVQEYWQSRPHIRGWGGGKKRSIFIGHLQLGDLWTRIVAKSAWVKSL